MEHTQRSADVGRNKNDCNVAFFERTGVALTLTLVPVHFITPDRPLSSLFFLPRPILTLFPLSLLFTSFFSSVSFSFAATVPVSTSPFLPFSLLSLRLSSIH